MTNGSFLRVLLLAALFSSSALHAIPPTQPDWAPVGLAFSAAESAWDADCPHDVCSTTNPQSHAQRIAAFQHAYDLLNGYYNAYIAANGTNPDDNSLRLLYRFGIVYDGLDKPSNAYVSYQKCVTLVGARNVVYTQDNVDQPLRSLCATAMQADCKLADKSCSVALPSANQLSQNDPPPPVTVSVDTFNVTPPNDLTLNLRFTQQQMNDLALQVKMSAGLQ